VPRSDGAAVPDDHVIVLFGALGDLARRKLLPGLFHLDRAGLMPAGYKIIGTSRKGGSHDAFRRVARDAIGDSAGTTFERFAQRLSFSAFGADATGPLEEAVAHAEDELGGEPRRLHYLSIPPGAFGDMVSALGSSGLTERARVVLEKPFGVDLQSARGLNALVHGVLPEERVFRIDHFLGREAVQNLIALRFANGMFEPIWNRDHIDHVQIDVPETLAVDDRAGFYEDTGAYRDMVVTHLFHVLGFVAMEPPTTLEARSIVEETGKVFRSVSPIDPDSVIRGQYAGYREGPGVDGASQTETFIALRAGIDNWRWSGVPFFLRTGKVRRRRAPDGCGVERRQPSSVCEPVQSATRVWPLAEHHACRTPGCTVVIAELERADVHARIPAVGEREHVGHPTTHRVDDGNGTRVAFHGQANSKREFSARP
jgi:glucose-6-phosphate 1-dehydrogenase